MGAAQTAPVMPVAAPQMVAVAPVDPKTSIFGIMMFLPLLGMILAAIVLTAAIQGVVPGLVKTLIEGEVAGISMIWAIVGGLVVLLLLVLMFSALAGGGGGTKAKKEKKPKAKKEKKPKAKKEKKAKKKKK
jgi:phosphotransferase system  glucose/maltose/N-acetylglucosamine-specific IIC component